MKTIESYKTDYGVRMYRAGGREFYYDRREGGYIDKLTGRFISTDREGCAEYLEWCRENRTHENNMFSENW